MSYLNHAQDPRRRTAALTATVAIHAALGVLVLTGLTMVGDKPVDEYNPIIEFPTEPPPPLPEPDPQPQPDHSFVAPTPPIPIPLPQPGPRADEFDPNLAIPDVAVRPDPGPTLRPDPPRPTPSFTPRGARPSNNQARWITTDDYPRRTLIDGVEGIARYRLIVGTNGRVSSCEVTASSGNRLLDEATCKLIASRARFDPATDGNGARVLGDYTGTVRWQIPD